jgi:chromosome segregation ATPase
MDEIIEKIPLPNQLPKPPDMSRLPPEALRSSAVESLLGQNSDLMARLGVSLRKTGILETKLSEMEKENLHIRHRYDAVKDQVLVIQEKERLLAHRSSQVTAETADLRDRLTNLEKQYTETYLRAQSLEQQLRSLRNYRFRMKTATKNLKTKARQLMDMLQIESQQSKNIGQTFVLAERELRALREETSETQMQLVTRYETEITQLTQRYENEIQKNYVVEINQLKSEIEIARRRGADRDMLYDAKVRIENQLIFEERQSSLYREETQKELQSTKEENVDLRNQLKTRLIEMERIERELKSAQELLATHDQQEIEKTDQIESLQLLWKDKQTEVERLEEKNRSLQKLNQQLSVTLNSQRKDIIELKGDIEKTAYVSNEKINALECLLKK